MIDDPFALLLFITRELGHLFPFMANVPSHRQPLQLSIVILEHIVAVTN